MKRVGAFLPRAFAARLASVFVAFALFTGGNCPATPESKLKVWPGYSLRFANPLAGNHWLVIKCELSDKTGVRALPAGLPSAISDLDTYINLFWNFGGVGTGNLLDYYRDVTYGALEFSPTVLGWYPAGYDSTYGNNTNRADRVARCANNIPTSEGIDFTEYDGIIALTNDRQDSGAGAIGKTGMNINGTTYQLGAVVIDPYGFYTAFASHEVGHGLGMPHSWDNTPCEYCDQFDIMSALDTWEFYWPNYVPNTNPTPPNNGIGSGGTGPGANLPNLIMLTGGSAGSTNTRAELGLQTFTTGDRPATYTIAALSHPEVSNGLGVIINNPRHPNDLLTVEYRQADGWDAGMPSNLVLVHEFCQNGDCLKNNLSETPYSFLREGPTIPNGGNSGGYAVGQTYTDTWHGVKVYVQAISTSTSTATVIVSSLD